jgi:hypothetical protein
VLAVIHLLDDTGKVIDQTVLPGKWRPDGRIETPSAVFKGPLDKAASVMVIAEGKVGDAKMARVVNLSEEDTLYVHWPKNGVDMIPESRQETKS